MNRLLRRAALLAGLLTLGATPISGASAQTTGRSLAGFVGIIGQSRYIGQVIALDGRLDNPTGVMLQLGTDSTDIKLGPRYTAQPQSAEAEVEGLAVGDYALVTAHLVRGDLVAQRVQFDVEPFGRMKLITGSVTWVSPNGKHLRLRVADTGNTRVLQLVRSTQYEIDGKVQIAPLLLAKEQTVQVLILHDNFQLYAVDVNLKTSPGVPPHYSGR
jgi:hypothetical protein